jgi:hypothetical protein
MGKKVVENPLCDEFCRRGVGLQCVIQPLVVKMALEHTVDYFIEVVKIDDHILLRATFLKLIRRKGDYEFIRMAMWEGTDSIVLGENVACFKCVAFFYFKH